MNSSRVDWSSDASEACKFISVVASALDVTSWSAHRICLNHCHPDLAWKCDFCEKLSSVNESGLRHPMDELPIWCLERIRSSHDVDSGSDQDSMPVWYGDFLSSQTVLNHHEKHLLGWAAIGFQEVCYCFGFVREKSARAFTRRDAAVLQVLAQSLLLPALSIGSPPQVASQHHLSRRQQDVLDRLLLGRSVKQVAVDLGLSYHTVNDYVRALHKRFGVSSRGELLALVHEQRMAESRS